MVQSLADLRPQVLEQQYARLLPQGIEVSQEQETDLQRELDIDF